MKLLFSFVNLIESINIPVIPTAKENRIAANFGNRNPSATEEAVVSLEQIALMEHALGNASHYRNHFLASENSRNEKLLKELEKHNLVTGRKPPLNAQGTLFHVTEEGKKLCFINEKQKAS